MPKLFEDAFKKKGLVPSNPQNRSEKKKKKKRPSGGDGSGKGKGNTPPDDKIPFYLLPSDTRETIKARFSASKKKQSDFFLDGNFSLNFYRLLPCEGREATSSPHFKNDVWRSLQKSYSRSARRAQELLRNLSRRLEVFAQELRGRGLPVKKLTAGTQSRLVTGLGLESVLEAGLALNRIYGLPYLSGSALKGVGRAWWREELFSSLGLRFEVLQERFSSEKDRGKFLTQAEEFLARAAYWHLMAKKGKEKKALEEARKKWQSWVNKGLFQVGFEDMLAQAFSFSLAFGSQNMAGALRVSDFQPKDLPELELDLINCHYQPYYTNNRLPTEWEDPVPVTFAVVPEGASFEGLIWVEPPPGFSAKQAEALLEEVLKRLGEALWEWGLGGKTAIGFGRLKLSS